MLNKIEEILKKEKLPVFYGLVPEDEDIDNWNYFVHNRADMEKSGNVDYKQYYQVHIVCENYVPEEMVIEIVKKIKAIPGMRVADIPIKYNYILKGNTGIVVEMATITFVRTVKGCE